MNIFTVSFAFPPLAYPRSIQVARLLRHLDAETVLFRADEPSARRDETIEPSAEAGLAACIRVPVRSSWAQRVVNRATYRFAKGGWNRRNLVPDQYRNWGRAVVYSAFRFLDKTDFHPDRIVTFAQPFTDHLIGAELKDRLGVPWLAYSSDPWTDNPFAGFDDATLGANLELERRVTEKADALIFTSVETLDLYFRKYSDQLRRKGGVLPQCFDAERFKDLRPRDERKITIRYLGNFYGKRSPVPLIIALEMIAKNSPGTLENIGIELIGLGDRKEVERLSASLPDGVLSVKDSVDYDESLRLMSSSDGLLLIDAPAELSVFLPSKLIDYIGSGRPIFGITPRGTAATLLSELGGTTADPSDAGSVYEGLTLYISDLKSRREHSGLEPWGRPEVRARFSAKQIGADFRNILESLA